MKLWLLGMAIMGATPSGTMADSFAAAAHCYETVQSGAPQEAVAACSRALKAEGLSAPNRAVTANNRGRAYLRLGDPAAAEQDFTNAIAADPGYAHPYNNRALARMRMGNRAGARSDLDKALTLEPAYAHALFHRAALRLEAGESAGARADLDAALEVRPDFAAARAMRETLGEPSGTAAIETAEVAPMAAAAFMMALAGAVQDAAPDAAGQGAAEAAPAPTELPDPADLARASGIAAAGMAPALAIPDRPKARIAAPAARLPARLNPAPTLEEFENAFSRGALDVRWAQRLLREHGYRPGPADGVYGEQTRQALNACLQDGCPISLR